MKKKIPTLAQPSMKWANISDLLSVHYSHQPPRVLTGAGHHNNPSMIIAERQQDEVI
jgi:hypothetical protein